MTLPPIPTSIPSPLGPVKVRRKPDLKSDGVPCCGVWFHPTRTITIESSLEGAVAWQTLLHELVHVALMDAGVNNLMSDAIAESVCDSVATLFTTALRAGKFAPHPSKRR